MLTEEEGEKIKDMSTRITNAIEVINKERDVLFTESKNYEFKEKIRKALATAAYLVSTYKLPKLEEGRSEKCYKQRLGQD